MRVRDPIYRTRQTRQMGCVRARNRRDPWLPDGSGKRSGYQITGFNMEHLPGTTLDGTAHQQHVAAGIDTGQEPTVVKPVTEGLFAHGKAFVPRYLLSDSVAGGGLQKNVGSCDPSDSNALRRPSPARGPLAPSPRRRLFRSLSVSIGDMGA